MRKVYLAISFRGLLETFRRIHILDKALGKSNLRNTLLRNRSAEVNLAISFRQWAESPRGHWTALAMVTGQN